MTRATYEYCMAVLWLPCINVTPQSCDIYEMLQPDDRHLQNVQLGALFMGIKNFENLLKKCGIYFSLSVDFISLLSTGLRLYMMDFRN